MKYFEFDAQEPSELTKILELVVATEFSLESSHYMLCTASHHEVIHVYSNK